MSYNDETLTRKKLLIKSSIGAASVATSHGLREEGLGRSLPGLARLAALDTGTLGVIRMRFGPLFLEFPIMFLKK